MYIVIACSEDGDISIKGYKKEELLTALNDRDYGDIEFFMGIPDRDPVYWGNKVLIIKGRIVSPKIYIHLKKKFIADLFPIDIGE